MLTSMKKRGTCALHLHLQSACLRVARFCVPPQGPPNLGRVNGQGIMGRGNGRGTGGPYMIGGGGPYMMNAGPISTPTPRFSVTWMQWGP